MIHLTMQKNAENSILKELRSKNGLQHLFIVYNGKIGSIFREKNQAKQVSAGLECGITLKDFNDYQKKDIIEVFNSITIERTI